MINEQEQFDAEQKDIIIIEQIENDKNEEEEEEDNNKNIKSENVISNEEDEIKEIVLQEIKDIEEKEEEEEKIEENEPENPNKIIENEEDQNSNKKIDESLKIVKLQKSKDNDISEQLKSNKEDDKETFPSLILGEVIKKGKTLGFNNIRYLEIDSEHGLLKRWASPKEYQKKLKEAIPIKALTYYGEIQIAKEKKYYSFQLKYLIQNKNKNKLEEITHIYKLKHAECRAKWLEYLNKIWRHLVKKEPLPTINKKKKLILYDQPENIEKEEKIEHLSIMNKLI